MHFLKIISNKRFTIISILLLLYIFINLIEGERGLISYYEKQRIKNQLLNEKKIHLVLLDSVKKKNYLLTENIDLDYLETLYRKKFMVGKSSEKIYKSN